MMRLDWKELVGGALLVCAASQAAVLPTRDLDPSAIWVSSDPPGIKCPKSLRPFYIPHQQYPNLFYRCELGFATEYRCPLGSNFDFDQLKCVAIPTEHASRNDRKENQNFINSDESFDGDLVGSQDSSELYRRLGFDKVTKQNGYWTFNEDEPVDLKNDVIPVGRWEDDDPFNNDAGAESDQDIFASDEDDDWLGGDEEDDKFHGFSDELLRPSIGMDRGLIRVKAKTTQPPFIDMDPGFIDVKDKTLDSDEVSPVLLLNVEVVVDSGDGGDRAREGDADGDAGASGIGLWVVKVSQVLTVWSGAAAGQFCKVVGC